MSPIKELLFKLLDEIEPYELLYVFTSKNYNPRIVCSNKSMLPIATEIIKIDSYMYNYFDLTINSEEKKVPEYVTRYYNENTIQINNEKYLITEKILYIKYHDDYIELVIQNEEETFTVYESYDYIQNIKRVNMSNGKLLEYNQMMYYTNNN